MQYHTFLQSLDDSQLLAHIHTLSQSQEAPSEVPPATSTPTSKDLRLLSASSFGSDPFDDGLDSALLKIPFKSESSSPSNVTWSHSVSGLCRSFQETDTDEDIARNQLALIDTEDDEEPTEKRPGSNSDSEANREANISVFEPNISDLRSNDSRATENHTRTPNKIFDHFLPDLEDQTGPSADLQPKDSNIPAENSPNDSDIEDDTHFGVVGPQHDFGDHETYFQNKHKKQLLADQEYIRWEQARRRSLGLPLELPPIFANCVIFVNGNTIPTLDSIHKTVILHGGIFLSHLQNKGAATHIVCDRLTPRKRIQFKNYRVVKAKWIVDCVQAGMLLDWKKYRLIDDIEPYQKRLGFRAVYAENENADSKGLELTHLGRDFGDKTLDFENQDPEGVTGDSQFDIGSYFQDPDDDDWALQLENGISEGLERSKESLNAGIQGTSGKDQGRVSGDENGDNNATDGLYWRPEDGKATLYAGHKPTQAKTPPFQTEISVPRSSYEDHDSANPVIGSITEQNENNGADSYERGHGQGSKPDTINPPLLTPQALSQLKRARPRTAFVQMDAKHPDFLKHFFANSRLHHLSTWKADLRAKFVRMVVNSPRAPAKNSHQPIILHIDFDCFFAAASVRKYPDLDLQSDPIAVSHGGASSDVASCNYVARSFGVRNGMWLGRAQELCRGLRVVDYDFEAYEALSHAFYSYLVSHRTFHSIFPVSIDEVLVDATDRCYGKELERSLEENVESLCSELRRDILRRTGCSVSIGAGHNVLLAKLALKKAKPDGIFTLLKDPLEFLDSVEVRELPGVGRGLYQKLVHALAETEPELMSKVMSEADVIPETPIFLKQIRQIGLPRLSKILGEKTAVRIHENALGIDKTSIILDKASVEGLTRKNVSVDVNYGIRFDAFSQAETFLINLAKELHSRMIDLGVCGSGITLRLARRAPDAPYVTPKYLGLGKVNFFSKSSSLGVATNDWGILGSEMKALFRMLNIPVHELRGISVTVTKLEDIEETKRQRQLNFGKRPPEKKREALASQNYAFAEKITSAQSIDWEVFNELPSEVRAELKKELLRRGIPVSAREKRPDVKSDFSIKSEPFEKVYYQQIFPSQVNGTFKTLKIKESPRKKRRHSPKKAPAQLSPTKKPGMAFEWENYDEEVLKEIPTSIREEFMQDVRRHKKHQQLGYVSMKEKIEKKAEKERQIRQRVISETWVKSQPRLMQYAKFNGQSASFHTVVSQIIRWVSQSIHQEGPHLEDVAIFKRYISELLQNGSLTRCICLVQTMEKEVNMVVTMVKVGCVQNEHLSAGIHDWQRHISVFRSMIHDHCSQKGIEVW